MADAGAHQDCRICASQAEHHVANAMPPCGPIAASRRRHHSALVLGLPMAGPGLIRVGGHRRSDLLESQGSNAAN
eukprot:CAMPEP_0170638118 /NCGR_PEP_ID=MMETSP0224-20130122/38829_1 /TAXON_ID=285029 /ORGANISM="Togula jolla, Strain CCCM 725" /LENGTH=74 /DNA_ID=CAMNT_0010968153 /DNA_START=493 /DNA_END=717 /DNA_ORIENTATION=+